MRIFEENVNYTTTSLPFNVLQVEDFSEIFFEVYEVKIGDVTYVAEKISDYHDHPVISVPVSNEYGTEYYPFVLSKGTQNIVFSEHNNYLPNTETYIDFTKQLPLVKIISPPKPVPQKTPPKQIIQESVKSVPPVEEESKIIKFVKRSVNDLKNLINRKANIELVENVEENVKSLVNNDSKLNQRIKNVARDTQTISKVLEEKADSVELQKTQKILSKLKNDTETITSQISEDISDLTEEISHDVSEIISELKGTNKNIQNIHEEFGADISNLNSRLNTTSKDVINLSEELSKEVKDVTQKINTVSKTTHDDINAVKGNLTEKFNAHQKLIDNNKSDIKGVSKDLTKEVGTINSKISDVVKNSNSRIDKVNTLLGEKIDKQVGDVLKKVSKTEKAIVENSNSLSHSNKERDLLLNNLNVKIDETAQEVGRVESKIDNSLTTINEEVDKVKVHLVSEIDRKVVNAKASLKRFYENGVKGIIEQCENTNEETKEYLKGLIEEQNNQLIEELNELRSERVQLDESVLTEENQTLIKEAVEEALKDVDKNIHNKFENYKTDLRRYVMLNNSGGGTVAVQYQNGGTMNGRLHITDNLVVDDTVFADNVRAADTVFADTVVVLGDIGGGAGQSVFRSLCVMDTFDLGPTPLAILISAVNLNQEGALVNNIKTINLTSFNAFIPFLDSGEITSHTITLTSLNSLSAIIGTLIVDDITSDTIGVSILNAQTAIVEELSAEDITATVASISSLSSTIIHTTILSADNIDTHFLAVSLLDTHLYCGTIVNPTLIDNGNGTVTISDDGVFTFSTGEHGALPIETDHISGGTFLLDDDEINYIIAKKGSPTLSVVHDLELVDRLSAYPVYIATRHENRIAHLNLDHNGLGLPEKLALKGLRLRGAEVESGGFDLGTTNFPIPRVVTLTSGIVWYGTNSTFHRAINSSLSSLSSEMQLVHHSGGVYVQTPTRQYNNNFYDDGNNLVALTNGKYAVNFVYRTFGENVDDIYLVPGSGNYSLQEAEDSRPPDDLPHYVTTSILVGRIIAQKSNNTPFAVETSLNQLFGVTGITDHNQLNNLQGGNDDGLIEEFYHLTLSAYNRVEQMPALLSSARMQLTTINTYADDAAADADTNLLSGEFYHLTGSRIVYRKP